MRSSLPPVTRLPERRLAGIALRLGAVTAFAIMAAALKLAADRGASLLELVFARNLFSLPVVAAWVTVGPGWSAVRTRRPMAHIVRAALGFGSMMLNFLSLMLLPLADATTIGFSAPLFATTLSALLLGEVIGPHRWGAVAIGFVGVAIVMQPGGTPIAPIGLAVAVAAALSVGAVTITLRQIGMTEGVAATVFWFSLACLLASSVAMPFVLVRHEAATWGLLVLMGAAGGCAQIFNTGSLRLAPVSVVVPFDYSQLLYAVLFGWLLWGDVPGRSVLAGGGLIVASGLYTVWRERRLRRATPPALPSAL